MRSTRLLKIKAGIFGSLLAMELVNMMGNPLPILQKKKA